MARGGGIIELVDEILSLNPNAAGLAINWQCFGSNGQEKADYSRGVLERFTRRAPKNCLIPLLEGHPGLNAQVKTIADPRKINFWHIPHYPLYFNGFYSVNENGGIVHNFNIPVTVEKIALNHYRCMSREEYFKRITRGDASKPDSSRYTEEMFRKTDINDEFDDGILKYRAVRAEKFYLKSTAERINRVAEALTENLSEYADGKKFSIETALTCRALSTYLREKFPHDAEYWKICEETSLSAVLKSINGMNMVEAMIFIRELPNLQLKYPVVDEINRAALQIMSQMKDFYRLNGHWKEFTDLDYIQELIGRKFL